LSVGGVPILPEPHGAPRSAAIHQHFYEVLMPEQRADSLWNPENNIQWNAFFRDRRQRELAHYEGGGPPPARQNAEGRQLWWGVSGRMVAAVMDHIAAGGERLMYPAQARRWAPQRMASSTTRSSSRSSSSTPRTPTFSGVKRELEAPRAPSPLRGRLCLVQTKEEGASSRAKKLKEEAVSQEEAALAEYKRHQLDLAANDDPKDYLGHRTAERASFDVVQPASMEFAFEWSRREMARERVCRLGNFVDLAANDDEAGPNGRGDVSSRASKDEPPSDGDSEEYTVFYRHIDL
jgi:hypothetical protein